LRRRRGGRDAGEVRAEEAEPAGDEENAPIDGVMSTHA
jgi:hypothetical protein